MSSRSSRLDLLVHPVRLQILHAFGEGDLVLAREDLASRLSGVPSAVLAEHLGILVENGLIAESGDGADTRYQIVPGEAVIGPGDLLRATPADHLRYFTTFVAGMIENFARYIRRPDPVFGKGGASYRQVTLYLDEEEGERLSSDIEGLFTRYAKNQPGGHRRPMVVTRIMLPEVQAGDES